MTVVSTYGQLSELFCSLTVLARRRNGLIYRQWARDLSPAARQAATVLSGLVSCPPPLDLITLISPSTSQSASQSTSLEAGVDALLEAPTAAVQAEIDASASRIKVAPPRWLGDLPNCLPVRRGLTRSIEDFYDTALSPHWPRLRAHLDAQSNAYARTLASRGVHAFLESLHPELRWSPPTLTLLRPDLADEWHAQGRGLVISPVVFAQRVGIFHSVVRPEEPIVVLVPALRSIADAQAVWGAGGLPTSRALSALLGETRAAALDVISDSCTTTELGRRLGISPATASHHASVLRCAGLVTTQRLGSAVLHTVTPLGTQLLNGRSISE
ncbi:MAG TPA: winged helix-turn-helix domain-containing protein [Streptosporangiaceae bacterium]|nr:winged helix-turn-helix domain-containing protein [Streptosporangiaceae bacterium]